MHKWLVSAELGKAASTSSHVETDSYVHAAEKAIKSFYSMHNLDFTGTWNCEVIEQLPDGSHGETFKVKVETFMSIVAKGRKT